ncbi:MAG: HAMP domain-containing histidine kinase [Firmicutes bacterium]|nr:HAMP domain-containing histidine kinase [Bacillota bacterium]
MIKRMRLKFFAVTSVIVFAIVAIFCGAILISTRVRDKNEAEKSLNRMVTAFERVDESNPPNSVRLQMNDLRSFMVMLDSYNKPLPPEQVSSFFTKEEMVEYATQILENGGLKGFYYKIAETPRGKIMVAIDMTIENEAFSRLTLTVVLLGAGGIIVLLILVWFLSFRIVKPATISLEKQKRFISEASHEINTPITIISAGVELLQKQDGIASDTKKWLDAIRLQTQKIASMATDLLALSKLDEDKQVSKIDFDLSNVILNTALGFESVAYEKNKELLIDIAPEIRHIGNPEAIARSITILIDNAIKHSDDNGIITVCLKKQNSKTVFTITNSCKNLTQSETSLLFERFYRGNEARANTSGAGLGLAILKTLSEQNDFKIEVKLNLEKITFSVAF